jgi:transcriptional/translational regulatory protein YebC/TACO1
MAGQGAVSYLFQRVGEIIAPKNGKSADDIVMVALENNVTDYEEIEDAVVLYTEPGDLSIVKKGLEDSGIVIEDAGLVYRPMSRIEVDDESGEKLMALIEKLEDMDDVQKVYTNLL